ncbi:ribosomal L1 domain-containing protein 1 isoform X3 [Carcharodon carcharias]|uniref:ribosomal L1 domain-containing protein 1 isoform X3 n=1 Tax=Carcharodon carcharias TaxID=13397 RepID=UPI001B7E3FBF|nr:ribosomal L1 domain-containing protein 1 isoform X3 [Carcharodon carcharias]
MGKMAALDSEQVAKAVKALQAYVKKSKNDTKLFLNEDENIMLNVTVWKIPNREQTIKITLPHSIRSETMEVCLFTKDEPNMTTDQTERFYKRLLSKHGIENVTQVIPYKTLKTEYKPFEAKRRLLSRFDLFLADDRIRRFLPSHLGKHFYKSKKAPLSVKLSSKSLAKDLNKRIQGTILPVNKKGSCYASRVAHTGMKLQDTVENVIAAVSVITKKLPKQQWKNVKILHLKTTTSVALPIYASGMENLQELEESLPKTPKKKQKANKQKKATKVGNSEIATEVPSSTEVTSVLVEAVKAKAKKPKSPVANKHATEEEIPQLVPIEEQTPTKKAKLQGLNRKKSTTPKAADGNETPVGEKLQQEKCKKTPQTPKQNPESLRLQTPVTGGKCLQTPKQEVGKKDFLLESSTQKKTAKNPQQKSVGAPKTKKLVKSATKTPRQKQKRTIPQSV